jgi:hypothetical protein
LPYIQRIAYSIILCWSIIHENGESVKASKMQRVAEINLERGMPTVEAALQAMRDALTACRRRGLRAAILIHGYGSTGAGGAIRAAVRRCLGDGSMSGFVRDYAGGEQWHWRKKELLSMCKELAAYEPRIANNEGVTVVIIK